MRQCTHPLVVSVDSPGRQHISPGHRYQLLLTNSTSIIIDEWECTLGFSHF